MDVSMKSVKILTYPNIICTNLCAEPAVKPFADHIEFHHNKFEVRLKQSINTLASSRNMYAGFYFMGSLKQSTSAHGLCYFVYVIKESNLLK